MMTHGGRRPGEQTGLNRVLKLPFGFGNALVLAKVLVYATTGT